MYYKVTKDDRVIDVLDQLIFLKYNSKYKNMVLCSEDDAQAILSSDGDKIWHEETLYKIPVDGYDDVRIDEIDKYEYEQLKMLNFKSPNEIIDSFVLHLISEGVL